MAIPPYHEVLNLLFMATPSTSDNLILYGPIKFSLYRKSQNRLHHYMPTSDTSAVLPSWFQTLSRIKMIEICRQVQTRVVWHLAL